MKISDRARALLGNEVIAEHDLRDMVSEMGSQRGAARKLGLTNIFVHEFLRGKKSVGKAIPRALGFRRVTVYVKD